MTQPRDTLIRHAGIRSLAFAGMLCLCFSSCLFAEEKEDEQPVDVEVLEVAPAEATSKVKLAPEDAFQFQSPPLESIPVDKVRVAIVEGLSEERSWTFAKSEPQWLFDTEFFALKNLPKKYDAQGMLVRREAPLLLQISGRIQLPAGEYELLIRSVDAARLYLDDELLSTIPFNKRRSGAHSAYYEGLDRGPEILSLAEGHSEERVTVKLDGGEHVLNLYRLIVSKKLSQHLGELIVAARPLGGEFRILGAQRDLPFTDSGWLDFLDWEKEALTEINSSNRRTAAESDNAYWTRRHDYAREQAGPAVAIPDVKQMEFVRNDIDRFLLQQLEEKAVSPTLPLDDRSFLRRLSLDTIGVIPTPEMIAEFESLPAESRRQTMTDRLLEHPGWADHWVSYWQDVLAENPGLIKPELNNSGPFRWFLHESFLDNKPFDRFVTELVLMGGDRFAGAPAAFAVASQNDAPMAAKAHVIGTAFLGIEMKCARCHDAPYHDVTQEQLFQVAAMLNRGPQKVPGSSSIQVSPEVLARMTVKVTLPPGSAVAPEWPFEEFTEGDEALPTWFMKNRKDARERLAAQLTAPHNQRFAKVIVNRLWKRYLGRGLVEPVDDWEGAGCSHPELLSYLARELETHDYDLKHVARLILNSDVYHRQPFAESADESGLVALFPGPQRRQLQAEQLTDSLFTVAGKRFGSEELSMDLDARLAATSFNRFGIPGRAWEFVGVGNERDRPALNLPTAQSIIQLMTAFGWREQRQEPLTVRPQTITPLQPLALANGTAANRALDLSDQSRLTDFCLQQQSLDQFVEGLFARVFTRTPDDAERETLVRMLEDGYATRIVAGPEAVPPRRIYRTGVTWTTHFDAKSDVEIVRRQREIQNGDPPTVRLDPDWRERVEDVVWSLVNSPEFVFVP